MNTVLFARAVLFRVPLDVKIVLFYNKLAMKKSHFKQSFSSTPTNSGRKMSHILTSPESSSNKQQSCGTVIVMCCAVSYRTVCLSLVSI